MAHTVQKPEIAPREIVEQRAKVELERLIARRQREFEAARETRPSPTQGSRVGNSVRSLGALTRRRLKAIAKG